MSSTCHSLQMPFFAGELGDANPSRITKKFSGTCFFVAICCQNVLMCLTKGLRAGRIERKSSKVPLDPKSPVPVNPRDPSPLQSLSVRVPFDFRRAETVSGSKLTPDMAQNDVFAANCSNRVVGEIALEMLELDFSFALNVTYWTFWCTD